MSFNVSNRMYRPSMANYQVKFGQNRQNKISVEKGEDAETTPEAVKAPSILIGLMSLGALLAVQRPIWDGIAAQNPYPQTTMEAKTLGERTRQLTESLIDSIDYEEENLTSAEQDAYKEIRDGLVLINTGAKEVLQDIEAKTKGSKVNKTGNQTTEIIPLED